MKPKIVERPAFHVVGLREKFAKGKAAGIPALWERFVARMGEVKDAIPGVHYGVCEDDAAGGAFFYTAAAGVRSLGRAPEGMAGFTVPGGTFAVFTHRGPISTLMNTIAAVWQQWLPASGLRPTGAPDFELYDERFQMESPDSEVDICVPVAAPNHR